MSRGLDDDLLREVEAELAHLRSHIADFASREKFRPIAKRLRLNETETLRDPFVEWLLEGYAFLAARVRRKLDSEFPRFTENLLQVVYPHLAASVPSMIVTAFDLKPDPKALEGGIDVPRQARLTLSRRSGQRTRRVQFTTARGLRLWPLKVAQLRYLPDAASVRQAGGGTGAEAGIELTLEVTIEEETIGRLGADSLDLFLPSMEGGGALLLEALTAAARPGVVDGQAARQVTAAPLGYDREQRLGDEKPFEDMRDALLPYGPRSLDGYRLLQEFFAMPERFQFVRLHGLKAAFAGLTGRQARIVFPLSRAFPAMSGKLREDAVVLNAVPAVNLFRRPADEIRLTGRKAEYQIVPDGGDPTAFEVHSVVSVHGNTAAREELPFRPFFAPGGIGGAGAAEGIRYYAVSRRARQRSSMREIRHGDVENYHGGEAFISVVDESGTPRADAEVASLSLDLMVTNRHLPITIAESGRLSAEDDYGCTGIRLVHGPSKPRAGLTAGPRLWDMISHLSLNHLSLVAVDAPAAHDDEVAPGVEALRQLLQVYAGDDSERSRSLVKGLREARAEAVIRRAPPLEQRRGDASIPASYTRGLAVTLVFDPGLTGAVPLSGILSRVLVGHAEVNSVVETVLADAEGTQRAFWGTRAGSRVWL